MICVTFAGKEKKFEAEQISAVILTQMKGIAEGFTNKPVSDAVITVPAYFNDRQRMATINAAGIAGLNV
jgi:molecular chaperone DnaK (HSP70)